MDKVRVKSKVQSKGGLGICFQFNIVPLELVHNQRIVHMVVSTLTIVSVSRNGPEKNGNQY